MPEEVAPIAEFLGLTVEELFRTKLQVDYWCLSETDSNGELQHRDVFVLCPNQVGHDAGTRADWWHRGARCVFLTKGDRCEIHPVKPYECRIVFGCSEGDGSSNRMRIMQKWDTDEAEELVNSLWTI